MKKVSFADTAKIDKKQDGSIVVSLYVHDKKDKVEYFKTLPKTQDTDTNKTKKRTVKVKKSEKAKHREKLRVSSFLEADNWEYVLRVPVTGVDHATTWKRFKERYSYKHKDRPLKYVMVKCDGELYGVIKNAPIDGDKIPLVNIEHSIVSGFDSSMIDRIAKMTLKYKGTGDSYVKSQHLKTKKYKYVNLGGIDEFILPDNALVTRGHASIVFSGGTAEENEKAVQQFLSEKKVQEVAKKRDFEGIARKNMANTNGEWFPFLIGNVLPLEQLKYNEPIIRNYNDCDVIINTVRYDENIVYAETEKGDCLQFLLPCVYLIINNDTGLIYYIGSTRTPIHRYCGHFGINTYWGGYENSSGFYDYVKKHNLDFGDFRMLFLPVTYWKRKSLSGLEYKLPYCPFFEYDVIDKTKDEELKMAECYFQKVFQGSEIVFIPEKSDIFPEEDGIHPIHLDSDKTRNDCEKYYKKYKEHYLDIGEDPVGSCMEIHGGFYDVAYIYKMLEFRDRVDAEWWVKLRTEQIRFLQAVVPNNNRFKKHDDELVRGNVGIQIGKDTWSEDGKKITRAICFAVDGCIGKMKENEYPCFNGEQCKCFDISEESTVYDDEEDWLNDEDWI